MKRRARPGVGSLSALVMLLMFGPIGCDGTGSKPRPVTLDEPVEATVIGVIFPSGGVTDIEIYEEVARQQEERTRAVVRIYRPDRSESKAPQSDLIRRAVEDGCTALIVLAIDPQEVAPAIASARKQGRPVVLLDRPVTTNIEGLPAAPYVASEDEVPTARKLVEATIADAKAAGFPPDGPAVLMSHEYNDARSRARLKAVREALNASGVRILPEVKYEGFKEQAHAALKIAHEIAPHMAMVFGDDDNAVRGAAEFRNLIDKKPRRFILAGYAVDPQLMDLAKSNITAAMIDRRVAEPMRVAFDTALALTRGETVPGEIRTSMPMIVRSGPEAEDFFPPYAGKPEMLREHVLDPAEVSKGGPDGVKP